MTAITIFNGLFCEADSVAKHVVDITGFRLVDDTAIIVDAARLSGLDPNLFFGLLVHGIRTGKPAANEQLFAWLRLAVAEVLRNERDVVISGYTAMLAPAAASVLRVCLISELRDRCREAGRVYGYSENAARDLLRADDLRRCDWVISQTEGNDPWASALHDMVIPVGVLGDRQSAYLIVKQLAKPALQESQSSRDALDDFHLAAKAHVELSGRAYGLSLSSSGGKVRVRFKDHDRLLGAVARELSDSVAEMDGVKSVEIRTGRRYGQGDIYTRAGLRGASRGSAPHRPVECVPARPADYELAARVQAVLALQGYPVSVYAKDGGVSLTLTDHKALLGAVARNLCEQLSAMEGIKGVEVGVGTGYHQAAMSRRVRREMASRLLKNPERTFDLALAPRLQGSVGSLVVYDESALSRVKDIGLLILDVNMPGLDGIEVLRQLKRDRPDIPVLILADNGSPVDRDTCLDLGACAYLNKPVNAEVFSSTVQSVSAKGRCFP